MGWARESQTHHQHLGAGWLSWAPLRRPAPSWKRLFLLPPRAPQPSTTSWLHRQEAQASRTHSFLPGWKKTGTKSLGQTISKLGRPPGSGHPQKEALPQGQQKSGPHDRIMPAQSLALGPLSMPATSLTSSSFSIPDMYTARKTENKQTGPAENTSPNKPASHCPLWSAGA